MVSGPNSIITVASLGELKEYFATWGLLVVETTPTDRTVNILEELVPPPGGGVDTAKWKVPELASRPDGRLAVSSVALTKLVARLVPAAVTVDCLAKPLPATVIAISDDPTIAVAGEITSILGFGLKTLTVAEPEDPGSFTLVAVTVTMLGIGGMSGAVYKPVSLTVPTFALPPLVLFTDQVTPPLLTPETENCWVEPTVRVAVEGKTTRLMVFL
ncbi:MAG: hypothetical protein ACE5HC_10155 [Candidatus Binatia bacterium]